MKKSENYQFNLPELADQYDLEHWNGNTRLLDTLLKAVDDRIKALDDLLEEKSIFFVSTGDVIAFAGTSDKVPNGWLLCNGQEYLATDYPDLFDVIGRTYGGNATLGSFKVPDYREVALVGTGQNSTNSIATHDTYTLGQFKDDQIQNITGWITTDGHGGGPVIFDAQGAFSVINPGNSSFAGAPGNTSTRYGADFNASRVARAGTTTRGKRMGTNYIIKY
jgi:microcystin-dependent protein